MSDFTGANMTNGHLFRAKFDQANFTRANLTAAYIFCTHFSSVNLTGANIDRAIFDGVLMLGTIMPDGTRKSSSGTVPWCLR